MPPVVLRLVLITGDITSGSDQKSKDRSRPGGPRERIRVPRRRAALIISGSKLLEAGQKLETPGGV
jgi:hypothetical protein